MEINFKANLVSKTTVMQRNWLMSKYDPKEVSFVKLNLQSPEEFLVLKKLKNLWPSTYVSDILRESASNKDLVSVYALTTQKDCFEKLNPEKVLGLAEITNGKDEICLEYLQTNPEYKYEDPSIIRNIKGIGTAMLNSLKNLDWIKLINVNSLFSTILFYEENGFVLGNEKNYLTWKK